MPVVSCGQASVICAGDDWTVALTCTEYSQTGSTAQPRIAADANIKKPRTALCGFAIVPSYRQVLRLPDAEKGVRPSESLVGFWPTPKRCRGRRKSGSGAQSAQETGYNSFQDEMKKFVAELATESASS